MNRMPGAGPNPEKTLDLMWTRVRQRGDLPGFSKVIGAIVGAMRGENEREFNMTRTVLQDPALTQRVLRLANSAMYSVFGQNINTVSKAVIVLGTDSIGHLALGLKMIDGLAEASAESATARLEMEKALMAAHVARQVASAATVLDSEEAVVCSMLHSLGRMMVTFYLPEAWQAMQERVGQGETEQAAAHAALGLGLDAVGRLVAQQWGLPAPLVNSLKDVAPHDPDEPLDHADWLAAVATLSTRCAEAIAVQAGAAQAASREAAPGAAEAAAPAAAASAAGTSAAGTSASAAAAASAAAMADALASTLQQLSTDYAAMLGLEPTELSGAITAARSTAAADPMLARAGSMLAASAATPERIAGQALPAETAASVVPAPAVTIKGKPADAAQQLVRGVTEMRGAAGSASTAQLLGMAVETVFKGLGFSRTVAFLRNPEQSRYVARMMLGDGLQELAARLAFDDGYQPDVFHAALANDKMIFIENAQDPNFLNKLPRWWKEALPTAHGFMVLPLTVNRRPIGLIYGDWDLSLPPARIDYQEVVPLDQLRVLIVRAVEQRRQVDPTWGKGAL